MARLGYCVNNPFLDREELGIRCGLFAGTRQMGGLAQWKIGGYLRGLEPEQVLEDEKLKSTIQMTISNRENGKTNISDDEVDLLCIISNMNPVYVWECIRNDSKRTRNKLWMYIQRMAWTGYAAQFANSRNHQKMITRLHRYGY